MTQEQRFSHRLVAFCDELRDSGVDVSSDDVVTASRVVMAVNPLDRDEFYRGLKAALVSDPAESSSFDDVFAEFWDANSKHGVHADGDAGADADIDSVVSQDDSDEQTEREDTERTQPDQNEQAEDAPVDEGTADRGDELEHSSASNAGNESTSEAAFEVGPHEHATDLSVTVGDDRTIAEELSMLVTKLGSLLGTRPGFEIRRHPLGRVDLRGALQAARGQGWNDLPRERRTYTSTSVRFFVDVSHSMLQNLDQQFLFHFLFECTEQFDDVRTFFFDTTTTEATDHFESADISQAIQRMQATQIEWGSGTKIGACLRELLTDHPFLVDRNSIVIVISDGWDAGDLDVLRDALQEIDRLSDALLWLNPLASSERYEPKISGMQTALPYVDFFGPFGSTADLREIVSDLETSALVRR